MSEAGDIVLLALALAATLVVGLALLAVDVFVGRLQEKRTSVREQGKRRFTRRPSGTPPPGPRPASPDR